MLNGELDFTSEVKAVVIFVGTNNGETAPDHIYEGIVEIVKVVKKKLQDVIVVLPVSALTHFTIFGTSCILQRSF